MAREENNLRILLDNVGESISATNEQTSDESQTGFCQELSVYVQYYSSLLDSKPDLVMWSVDPSDLLRISEEARMLSDQGDLAGSLERSHNVLAELPSRLSQHAMSALPGDPGLPDLLPSPPWERGISK